MARYLWSLHDQHDKPLRDCYLNFAKWLQPDDHRTVGNAVITFNWDILVEKALQETRRWFQYDTKPSPCVPILKPHGSINWNAYRREGLVEPGDPRVTQWQPIVEGSRVCWSRRHSFTDPFANAVNENLRYMIYPGGPDLPSLDEDLKLVWDEAAAVLRESTRVVFIGYSLPDYDSFARQFFMDAIPRPCPIEVVSPSSGVLTMYKYLFGEQCTPIPSLFENSRFGHAQAEFSGRK